jgi:predicted RNA-binding Zn-ribbon protein involved in translation (DUF1610 family)
LEETMADHFIILKCPSCGAKLNVHDDMDRFACGYCGNEIAVQRRGGTVALRSITEAIRQVAVGTDRTAAELALQRLEKELNELNGGHNKALENPAVFGLLGILVAIFGLPMTWVGISESEAGTAITGVILLTVGAAIVLAVGKYMNSPESTVQRLQAEKSRVEAEIAQVKQSLASG